MSEIFPPVLWYIDDAPDELLLLRHIVARKMPATVLHEFSQGSHAIEAWRNASPAAQPQLIVCDLNMPYQSGWELWRALYAARPQFIPFALLSNALPPTRPYAEVPLGLHLKPDTPNAYATLLSQLYARTTKA